MLIFDIGANIGKYSIANQNGNKIVAVEASPDTYKKLYNSISNYSNIIALNYAVSKTPFSTTFYSCPSCDVLASINKDWLTSDVSRFGSFKDKIIPITVPTITLDTLISQYGIPDILKIDVEGAEEEVISTLTAKIPTLCFEWTAEWRDSMYRALDYLNNLGYVKYYVQYGDEYTFKPPHYDQTIEDVKEIIAKSKDKSDMGMVWCI